MSISISSSPSSRPLSSAILPERPLVVVAEIALAVGRLVEMDALRLEQRLVGLEMQRLGIGEHAVEVEDHRLHCSYGHG